MLTPLHGVSLHVSHGTSVMYPPLPPPATEPQLCLVEDMRWTLPREPMLSDTVGTSQEQEGALRRA